MKTVTNISVQEKTTEPAAVSNMIFAQEHVQNEISQFPLHNSFIQFKLAIGPSDDPLEHEADAMADNIMRMPKQNFIRRKCSHCGEERLRLIREMNT